MNISELLTDDQIAIVCCFGAVMVCSLIAGISFRFGPAGRQGADAQGRTLPLTSGAGQESTGAKERRAA